MCRGIDLLMGIPSAKMVNAIAFLARDISDV